MKPLDQSPGRRPATNTSSPLAWLRATARCCRRWRWCTVVLGTVAGLCAIVQAALFAHIIHTAVIEGGERSTLLFFFGALVVVIPLRALLVFGREVCGQRASSLVRRAVRQQLLARLAACGPIFIKEQQAAPLASSVLERIEALHGYFAHYLPQKSLALIVPLMIGLIAWSISWVVGLVFLCTAPLIPLFMLMIGRGAESLSQKNFQHLSRMSAHFLDTLQGLTTLKLFSRSREESGRLAASSESYRRGTMAVLRVAFLSSAVLEFLTAISIAMTAVFLGLSYLEYLGFGLYGRELSLATGLFLLFLAPDFYQPLRDLGSQYHARAEALGAADELHRILFQPVPEMPRGGDLILPSGQPLAVEFRQVEYIYPQRSSAALEEFSLQVGAGEWLAIVGASGAGKSTLLNLLLGFLPVQRGEILVNGLPLSHLRLTAWQGSIAWVPQQPNLFYGSLADNISLGDPKITAEAVAVAAKRAQLTDLIQRLPAGLASPIGEQGNQLSGGEARRLALARAFARDAPLIMLDEPTAGLDRENERLVMASLQQLVVKKTVLMLTHRLDTARLAHRIAVLDRGRLVETGSHHALLAAGGNYAALLAAGQRVC